MQDRREKKKTHPNGSNATDRLKHHKFLMIALQTVWKSFQFRTSHAITTLNTFEYTLQLKSTQQTQNF